MKFKVPEYYHVTKIFGPPGTGKTHTILKILKEKLDYGYAKEDVLLVGYSRATAQNLKDRCKKDLNFVDEELEPIKTLHAMCKKEDLIMNMEILGSLFVIILTKNKKITLTEI